MKYDIAKFEELVEQGYLRKSEKNDLVLYGYTDKCTFDRHWNEFTRISRGLILEKKTGEVVAKPFPKFFNIGEMEETFLDNLPKDKYEVFEKVDGSLGILFYYNEEWQLSTRGSFYSDQAINGRSFLSKYDVDFLPHFYTYLVEIIYPDNKIIVNYGDEKKLVLLGAFMPYSGEEVSRSLLEVIASKSGLDITKSYNYTIDQMIEMQKTMPKDQEGFVVRFENGLRVKIKGHEYLRIAKMLSQMSPLSFWEAMKNGRIPEFYLAQLPEEFRSDYEPIVKDLEIQYFIIKKEILVEADKLPTKDTSTHESRRTIGLFIKDSKDLKHKSAMFPTVLGDKPALDKYVMKLIRPTGNVIKTFEE
jgi:RNA ligase